MKVWKKNYKNRPHTCFWPLTGKCSKTRKWVLPTVYYKLCIPKNKTQTIITIFISLALFLSLAGNLKKNSKVALAESFKVLGIWDLNINCNLNLLFSFHSYVHVHFITMSIVQGGLYDDKNKITRTMPIVCKKNS